ncbi:hypothetical protein M422DRAFT_35779 [Sphaerobolus stellatus SS14]|uniref:Uncharacterized protein n=1 Tax=Sphaerobolus stellatus (strain SS14) TaxID=990650 RepID=A0A0C9TLJ0_SPHS4|nr:hypothetical protein M422DRAFT_36470 [Sphaerobolus stellatus SS14]KIJ32464.1 hypothetical protein M422DRAFT_35779 [Sphaerobolus stellatus SS14]
MAHTAAPKIVPFHWSCQRVTLGVLDGVSMLGYGNSGLHEVGTINGILNAGIYEYYWLCYFTGQCGYTFGSRIRTFSKI